jgi:hypothetical protein
MTTKKEPRGWELAGWILVLQGVVSTVVQLITHHDFGILGLVDHFIVRTAWWAGLVCASVGLALVALGTRKARAQDA